MTPEEVSAKMLAMIGALEHPDLTQAATSVVDDYIAQINNSFDNAVDPGGGSWEPIVYRNVPPPPLELSGALRDSVIADAQSAVIDQNGMGFATTGDQLVGYALGQDEGEEFSRPRYVGWVKKYGVQVHHPYITWHPGRPFLGLGEEALEKAAEHGADELIAQTMGVW